MLCEADIIMRDVLRIRSEWWLVPHNTNASAWCIINIVRDLNNVMQLDWSHSEFILRIRR